MKKLLHIADRKAAGRVWTPLFLDALKEIGDLTIMEGGEGLTDDECAERMRQCNILLTSWGARSVPASLADDRGELEYVCHVTGTVRQFVPLELVEAGIPVTNWGDAAANGIAEGAMVLLLAMVKNLRYRIEVVQNDGWRPDRSSFSSTLEGMNVGIHGYGYIGVRFVDMLRPFGSVMRIYDPYVDDIPDDCIRVGSLEELFGQSQAIVIHAGLSDETRGSVTADLLAMLPDNGIIINTARGGIVDQDALFAELETGRLLAGLDVLDPDRLPDGHPAKQWPNVIFTAHNIGASTIEGEAGTGELQAMHRICLDNLRRHVSGEPLQFLMDRDRYLRST
ncbi:MAG: NAD(P)-dependent oxidoreductase [Armatimonadota bacterium]